MAPCAISYVITRARPGVRTLERELAKLARKSLRRILEGKALSISVESDNLHEFAGVRKYKFGVGEIEDQVGAVTGLAWTEVGGELLTIEAVTSAGKGTVKTTGKLGDVMTESIATALSFVKARSIAYGIKPSVFEKKELHVHVPEGATPKDGPSAGVAMVTAIVSTLTGIAVRKDIAMTGEVTLRGRVLPIGGLKEKLLAALRGGITTVLIPIENEKDLAEIPANVTDGLTIIPVAHADQVLEHALVAPAGTDRVERSRRCRGSARSGRGFDGRRRGGTPLIQGGAVDRSRRFTTTVAAYRTTGVGA